MDLAPQGLSPQLSVQDGSATEETDDDPRRDTHGIAALAILRVHHSASTQGQIMIYLPFISKRLRNTRPARKNYRKTISRSHRGRFEALEGRQLLAGNSFAGTTAANETAIVHSDDAVNADDTVSTSQSASSRTSQPRGKKASFTINDAVISEPAKGATTLLEFTVFREGNTSGVASVDYQTVDGSAIAAEDPFDPAYPGDYVATSGTLVFGEGVTELDVSVLVNGDEFDNEGIEEFFLELTNADNATIKREQGVGFIQDTAADATSMYVESIRIIETKTSPESKPNYSFEIKVVDDLGNPVSGASVVVTLSDPNLPESDHDHIIRQWPGDTNASGILTVSPGKRGRFGLEPGKVYNVEVTALSHYLYAWEQDGFLDGDDDDIFPENFFRAGDKTTYEDIPDINHIEP